MEEHKTNDQILLEKITELQRDFSEFKEEMKPLTDAYSAAKNTGDFITWMSKIILAIGVIIGAVIGYTHIK